MIVALRSPLWDTAAFVLPGALAAAIGLAIGLGDPTGGGSVGPFLWVATVLLVDVAHVWASLYRTYLDPIARKTHARALIAVPLAVAWFGFLLHLESPAAYWTVLAYVAIHHFIRQYEGFVALYARKGGESRRDRNLARAAVWAGTGAPVVWWHANLPREFSWFIEGDLIGPLPRWLGTIALVAGALVIGAFAARRWALARAGRGNPLLIALVLVPAINWHLGIVWFNDDRVFTITNVFGHGIPYLALVWLAGGRDRVRGWLGRSAGPLVAIAYYGMLMALAVSEEALWDRLVWHDHPELFGSSDDRVLDHPVFAAAIVALLAVPQTTHYLLDRWIWRVGPRNPDLAEQLGLVEVHR